jgi:small subunit ribosomal protein S13
MARISGIELPNRKKVAYALPYIYGIGRSNVLKVLEKAKVDGDKRVSELSADEVNRIQKAIENVAVVEGDLRREVITNIRRKQSTGTYQGLRHKMGLPVRGQVTRHNARTRKGKKKTVSVSRK